jgi:hypothetical protein
VEQILAEPAGAQIDGWIDLYVLGEPGQNYYQWSRDAKAAEVLKNRLYPGRVAAVQVLWEPADRLWRCGFHDSPYLLSPFARTFPLAVCRGALIWALHRKAQEPFLLT